MSEYDSTTVSPEVYGPVGGFGGSMPTDQIGLLQAILLELRTTNALLAANWPQIVAARAEGKSDGGKTPGKK